MPLPLVLLQKGRTSRADLLLVSYWQKGAGHLTTLPVSKECLPNLQTGAHPDDVVRCEACPVALQFLCHRCKLLQAQLADVRTGKVSFGCPDTSVSEDTQGGQQDGCAEEAF